MGCFRPSKQAVVEPPEVSAPDAPLRAENARLLEQLADNEATIAQLQSQMQQLEHQSALHQQVNRRALDKQDELQAENSSLRSQLASKEAELESMEQDRSDLSKQVASVSSSLEAQQQLVKQQVTSIEAAQQATKQQATKITELEAQVQRYRRDKHKLLEALEKRDKALRMAQSVIDALQNPVSGLAELEAAVSTMSSSCGHPLQPLSPLSSVPASARQSAANSAVRGSSKIPPGPQSPRADLAEAAHRIGTGASRRDERESAASKQQLGVLPHAQMHIPQSLRQSLHAARQMLAQSLSEVVPGRGDPSDSGPQEQAAHVVAGARGSAEVVRAESQDPAAALAVGDHYGLPDQATNSKMARTSSKDAWKATATGAASPKPKPLSRSVEGAADISGVELDVC